MFGDVQVKLVDTQEIEPGQSQEGSQRASGASQEPARKANKSALLRRATRSLLRLLGA